MMARKGKIGVARPARGDFACVQGPNEVEGVNWKLKTPFFALLEGARSSVRFVAVPQCSDNTTASPPGHCIEK